MRPVVEAKDHSSQCPGNPRGSSVELPDTSWQTSWGRSWDAMQWRVSGFIGIQGLKVFMKGVIGFIGSVREVFRVYLGC